MKEDVKRGFDYLKIPAYFLDSSDLSPIELLILSEVSDLLRNTTCFASNEHFTKMFNVSESTTSRAIISLSEKKYLEAVYKTNFSGGTLRYLTLGSKSLFLKKQFDDSRNVISEIPETPNRLTRRTINSSNTIIQKNIKENNTTADAEESYSFDNFWKDYGKPVGKKECLDKWTKISSVDKEKIKNTVHQYTKKWPESKFRKDPIRYLSKQIWLDYEGLPSQTEEENIMTCRFYKLPEKFFQEHFGVSRKDLTERCYYEEIGSIQDVSEKKLKELGRTDFTNWF